MPGRRLTVLVSIAAAVFGGLVAWRAAQFRGAHSDRVLARTVNEFARRSERPVAWVSEDDTIDRAIDSAGTLRILPRHPQSIEAAVRGATVLAGPHGREFLEVLGYEVSSLSEESSEGPFPVSRVESRLRCAAVGSHAWSPLPGLEYTGRLGIVLPPATNGAMAVVVGDDVPLDVTVTSTNGAEVKSDREVLSSVSEAPPDYWLEERSPRDAPGEIQRITLAGAADRTHLVSMRLGRRAPRVLARLRGYGDDVRAMVCASPIGIDPAFAHGAREFVVNADAAAHFGTGWSDELLEKRAGIMRWMRQHGAVLVPFARRGVVRLILHAYRRHEAGAREVSLRINDVLDTRPLAVASGLSTYEWHVPASAWTTGTNEILIRAAGPGGERLLGFHRLQLALLEELLDGFE